MPRNLRKRVKTSESTECTEVPSKISPKVRSKLHRERKKEYIGINLHKPHHCLN